MRTRKWYGNEICQTTDVFLGFNGYQGNEAYISFTINKIDEVYKISIKTEKGEPVYIAKTNTMYEAKEIVYELLKSFKNNIDSYNLKAEIPNVNNISEYRYIYIPFIECSEYKRSLVLSIERKGDGFGLTLMFGGNFTLLNTRPFLCRTKENIIDIINHSNNIIVGCINDYLNK